MISSHVFDFIIVNFGFKYQLQEFEVNNLVSHDMPFARINQALDLMREKNCLRCVLHM
jgi:Zn-dependent alcohol dehydrogenase